MQDDDPLFIILMAFLAVSGIIMIIYGWQRSRKVDDQLQRADEINRRTMEVLDRWERVAERLELALDRLNHRP